MSATVLSMRPSTPPPPARWNPPITPNSFKPDKGRDWWAVREWRCACACRGGVRVHRCACASSSEGDGYMSVT